MWRRVPSRTAGLVASYCFLLGAFELCPLRNELAALPPPAESPLSAAPLAAAPAGGLLFTAAPSLPMGSAGTGASGGGGGARFLFDSVMGRPSQSFFAGLLLLSAAAASARARAS